MKFQVGDIVEVDSTNEEGYHGSYWEATVLAKKRSTNQYVVEYNEIYEEDLSARLQQVVSSDVVRPVPPKFPVNRYKFGDCVDVLDKDGWWTGTVSGVDEENESYYVNFKAFKVTISYDVSLMRMHQEWLDGKWFRPNCYES